MRTPFGKIFREIEPFLGVRLQKIRIHATGRSEHHFFYFGFERFGKHQPVQKKVRRRAGLVEVHVAAPAVARVTPGSRKSACRRSTLPVPRCWRMLSRWPLLRSSTMRTFFAPRASS